MATESRPGDAPGPQPPSDAALRGLLEHTLIGLYCTTLDGRIIDCNESMARMLGYASREELLTRPAAELYHSDADRAAFIAELRRRNGTLTNYELRLRRRDGKTAYILENVHLDEAAGGREPLIHGTMVDITQRELAEAALRESEQRHRQLSEDLRRLTQRLQTVREEERSRIAHEVHDELGRPLAVLRQSAQWLTEQGELGAPALERVGAMLGLLNGTLDAVRRICAELRPTVLDEFGLVAAIEWQLGEFERRTRIACTASLPLDEPTMPRDQATAVFRVLQESLSNVARHSSARRVSVRLTVDVGRVKLSARDDGVGISSAAASSRASLGLAGMRERCLAWGGQLEITGTPGVGTLVELDMPLAAADEAPR